MAKELELISLQDIIPNSISGDKNVKSIITAVDPELKTVSQDTREAFLISRIDELPEDIVDLLAWQWHVDFYEPDLPIATKRALVLDSIKWHRKKGTKAAIKSALEQLGFVPTIKEWFEPEMGTAPYTFSIKGYYKDDHIDVDFLGPETQEILERVIEITKPARANLLKLTIAPIPIDMTQHICIWDVCNWEHVERKKYHWGLFTPENSMFDGTPILQEIFERGIFTEGDIQRWDFSRWDSTPYKLLQIGRSFETGFFAELEDWIGTWHIPYAWNHSKFSWNDANKFYRPVGTITEQGFPITVDWKEEQQFFGTTFVVEIICDSRPYWDMHTWHEHGTWREEFEQQPITPTLETGMSASLEWGAEAPQPRWSHYKTWSGSKTWRTTTEQAATFEIGKWEYQEAV